MITLDGGKKVIQDGEMGTLASRVVSRRVQSVQDPSPRGESGDQMFMEEQVGEFQSEEEENDWMEFDRMVVTDSDCRISIEPADTEVVLEALESTAGGCVVEMETAGGYGEVEVIRKAVWMRSRHFVPFSIVDH